MKVRDSVFPMSFGQQNLIGKHNQYASFRPDGSFKANDSVLGDNNKSLYPANKESSFVNTNSDVEIIK